jgi:hypothetical protein
MLILSQKCRSLLDMTNNYSTNIYTHTIKKSTVVADHATKTYTGRRGTASLILDLGNRLMGG